MNADVGTPVATTAAPASVEEVSEVFRAATAGGQSVLIAGAGSKAAWGGTPSRVDVILQMTRLAGVVSHDPGDLVVTVRAGTRMRDLQAVVGLAGQRLALEAPSPQATVGGALAASEAGPLRHRFGTGRDLRLVRDAGRAHVGHVPPASGASRAGVGVLPGRRGVVAGRPSHHEPG